jgi:hypothetical protein
MGRSNAARASAFFMSFSSLVPIQPPRRGGGRMLEKHPVMGFVAQLSSLAIRLAKRAANKTGCEIVRQVAGGFSTL